MTTKPQGDFGLPGIPAIITKRHIADFIAGLIQKYRTQKFIVSTETLTHAQVEEILDGVRHLIYQYEEITPRKDGD